MYGTYTFLSFLKSKWDYKVTYWTFIIPADVWFIDAKRGNRFGRPVLALFFSTDYPAALNSVEVFLPSQKCRTWRTLIDEKRSFHRDLTASIPHPSSLINHYGASRNRSGKDFNKCLRCDHVQPNHNNRQAGSWQLLPSLWWFQFLSRLTLMFDKARTKGHVSVTMKRCKSIQPTNPPRSARWLDWGRCASSQERLVSNRISSHRPLKTGLVDLRFQSSAQSTNCLVKKDPCLLIPLRICSGHCWGPTTKGQLWHSTLSSINTHPSLREGVHFYSGVRLSYKLEYFMSSKTPWRWCSFASLAWLALQKMSGFSWLDQETRESWLAWTALVQWLASFQMMVGLSLNLGPILDLARAKKANKRGLSRKGRHCHRMANICVCCGRNCAMRKSAPL